ncbi:MAG: hydrogenase formation protein HypD [Phycisphaeraceae bacterium]|nr:hydrogenase formation protein HypD [Phycisphaeraceae bacterium]
MISTLDRASTALAQLDRAAQAAGRALQFMEVCGTHTMAAFRSGLHSLMPASVTLLSGPGCPVCVTAQADIDQMIELAQEAGVCLCTYGDMLRVPGRKGSLEKARGRGADVHVVYSSMEAVQQAERNPRRQVVFAAVGFETTAPATAAAVVAAGKKRLSNFSVIASHKQVVPAMLALLKAGEVRLDGFLCPGHVSVIIGSQVYRPLVADFAMPCVIAGFEEFQIAEALATLAQMAASGRAELVNQYAQAVTTAGNKVAVRLLEEVFEPANVVWRGLGQIPQSGLVVRKKWESFDARKKFNLPARAESEPAGCLCGQVIAGVVKPVDCSLFGTTCTPVNPIGPCMVSSEGTCQAWFKYGRTAGR